MRLPRFRSFELVESYGQLQYRDAFPLPWRLVLDYSWRPDQLAAAVRLIAGARVLVVREDDHRIKEFRGIATEEVVQFLRTEDVLADRVSAETQPWELPR